MWQAARYYRYYCLSTYKMSDTAQCHNLEPGISLDLIRESHIIIEHRAVVTRSAVVCCCMNGRGGCDDVVMLASSQRRDCGMGECLTSAGHCPGRPGPHLNSPLSLSLPNLFRGATPDIVCLLQPLRVHNYLRGCILYRVWIQYSEQSVLCPM